MSALRAPGDSNRPPWRARGARSVPDVRDTGGQQESPTGKVLTGSRLRSGTENGFTQGCGQVGFAVARAWR